MRYGLAFLFQCTTASFERNVEELVQLGRYSHARLKELVPATGITYDRLEKGILHFFSTQADFDNGAAGAEVMRRHGVDRRVLSRDEVLKVEPALARFGSRITGGTYTPSDESGDALVFTQKLAQLCVAKGAEARFSTQILRIERSGDAVSGVRVKRPDGAEETLTADAYVVATASYAPQLVNPVAECLNIYPAKGYSATLKLKKPEQASTVSLLDDTRKIAISRLGDRIRIAGTAELVGLDTSLNTPTSRTRCEALVKRYEELFPGVADLSEPNFWTGLRPSTPTNIPYIGKSKKLNKLWFNCGHGTLGWTHGAGSGHALATLISGQRPETPFSFYGV
jgi:D-amino-acid dehydrogenase